MAAVSAPVLVRTIPLPGVAGPTDRSGIRGRVDHLAYDAATKRLFVACIANGSLEVVDLDLGKRIKSIGGLKKPQSVTIDGRHGSRSSRRVATAWCISSTHDLSKKKRRTGRRGRGQHPHGTQRESLHRLRRR